MYEVKVAVTDVKDLLVLHRNMEQTESCNFDLTSGSISIDGKSLLGILGFSRKKFIIKVNGDEYDFLDFKERISSYIEK